MLVLLLTAAGCYGPMGPGLDQGEADVATEGQYDERVQDGTLADIQTDSLTADGAASTNGLANDPFLLSQEQELDSTRLNTGNPPGAQAILVPGPESNSGGPPADPGAQLPPG